MLENSGAPGVTAPPSRRTITKGLAWTAPALAMAVPAPAAAASLRKDPGINGWVLNSTRGGSNCTYTLEVDSTISGNNTPDGAPYGLYIYDVEPANTFSNARLVYWIIGTQTASVINLSGHSSCWSFAEPGATQTKADGLSYTPYTWNYTCPINSSSYVTDPTDGVKRLYLGDFHVRFSFTQPGDRCNDVTYWTQRFITIDRDGSGPEAAQVHTFERRNGSRGPFTGAQQRQAPQQDSTSSAPVESVLPS